MFFNKYRTFNILSCASRAAFRCGVSIFSNSALPICANLGNVSKLKRYFSANPGGACAADDRRRLLGQRAIVTGGGKGIGEAIALGYAKEGANVVITYARNEKSAHQVVSKIEELGAKAKAVKFDLLVPEDAENLLKESVGFMGGVDILVNNALVKGLNRTKSFLEVTEDDLYKDIVGNLIGSIRMTQKVCTQMIDQKSGGCIINILSMLYKIPLGNTASVPYEAAKAGLAMFTKSLGVGMGRYDIRVNGIAPGNTETEGLRETFPDKEKKAIIDKILISRTPLGRGAIPAEYQQMAIALVLSKFMTGEVVVIDGGVSHGSVFPLLPREDTANSRSNFKP